MAQDSFKIKKSLNIVPQAGTSNLDETGDMGYDSSADKLVVHTGGAPDALVTENKSQTLSNKTLNDPISNDGVFNDPEIQDMAATGGTLSAPTLEDAIINDPTVSNGTFSSPEIQNAAATGGTFQSPILEDAQLNDPILSNGSASNLLLNTPTINDAVASGGVYTEIELQNMAASGGTAYDLAIDASSFDNGSISDSSISGAVITLSDIDGGTASNSSRITLPKASKTTLDGLTRKEATLVYASDQDTVYLDNGSTLSPLGGNFVAYSNENISNGGTISLSLVIGLQFRRVTGDGAAVEAASAPFGSSAPADGTVIRLVGQSDEFTVKLVSSDTAKGILLNGDCVLGKAMTLDVQYDATLDRYVELSRNAY
jgi:hypothetical protein